VLPSVAGVGARYSHSVSIAIHLTSGGSGSSKGSSGRRQRGRSQISAKTASKSQCSPMIIVQAQ